MVQYIFVAIALLLLIMPTVHLRAKGYTIFKADKKNGTGVYGWLFLFVLLALYGGPLLSLGFTLSILHTLDMFLSLSSVSSVVPKYEIYIFSILAGMFVGTMLSALAGMVVVQRKPHGRETVKRLLTAKVLVESACSCGLPFLILPYSMAIATVNDSITGTLLRAFVQTAWILYFSRSQQVERTFSE